MTSLAEVIMLQRLSARDDFLFVDERVLANIAPRKSFDILALYKSDYYYYYYYNYIVYYWYVFRNTEFKKF